MMSMSRPLIAAAVSSSVSIGLAIFYCNKRQKAAATGINSFVERENYLKDFLARYGLEVYAFKVGWYNDLIDMIKMTDYIYKPDYPGDTIGFIILNTPYFFEKGFKPFVRKYAEDHGIDSLDTLNPFEGCMEYLVSEIKQGLPTTRMEYFSANKRLKGTNKKFGDHAAGDLAGGTRYYRREDVVPDHWPKDKIFGTSIHPRFGGWFQFRGALIFPELQYSGLLRVEPEVVVPTRDLRIELLEQFNNSDKRWRDVIDVEKRYSAEQRKFCNLSRKEDRIAMMRGWVEDGTA